MKVVAKRKWRYPMSLERQYAKQLVAYVKRKFAVIDEHRQEIIDVVAQYAVRMDDDSLMESVSAQISVLLDRIERDMESADDLTRAMNNMFDAVNRYNAGEFNALTKSLFGFPLRVPISQISHADSAGRYRADATLDDDISTLKMVWVRQNLALIKSIDADTMRRIEDKMMERIIANVSMGDLTKYLIKDIRDIAGVEVNRATLIGVDQVGKLNGRLTQYRQERAGISEYQWETALDSRVRPSHRPRQGKIYKWSNPPPDGHPGYPIRCRCVALPVINLDEIPVRLKDGTFKYVDWPKAPAPKPATAAAAAAATTAAEVSAMFPEQLAGVSRGEPMTPDEANFGRPNPHFEESQRYRINCQSCVVTYEARLRGYNVETLPNTVGSMLFQLSCNTRLAWIDPKTKAIPSFVPHPNSKTGKSYIAWLEKTIQSGQRYTLQVFWKQGGGHIVSIGRNAAGELELYDPQTAWKYTKTTVTNTRAGKTAKDDGLAWWFGRVRWRSAGEWYGPELLRVDDKEFNLKVVNEIMKAAEDGETK